MNNSTARVITILDYIGFLWILGLFVEKDDPAVKFHTNQGILLFIADAVVGVLFAMRIIPIIGLIFELVAGVLGLFCLILAILGIVNAAQGECKPLPVIGNLAQFIK